VAAMVGAVVHNVQQDVAPGHRAVAAADEAEANHLGERRAVSWPVPEAALKPAHVVPALEFPPAVAEYADWLAAHTGMARDARLVGHRDAGKCVAIPFAREPVEEREIQRAPDPLALVIRMHIARHFGRPAIRCTLTMRRCIGIADAAAVALGDEPLPG